MLALFVIVGCLLVNAFFVAAEFALVKVRITQLERAERRGDRRAATAKKVLERLDRYLSVTQFGITVASLGLGWIGEPALGRFADGLAVWITGSGLGRTGHIVADVLGLGVLTFLHLLLGELVPKFIALQYAEKTVLGASLPLLVVSTVFRPVLFVLEGAQRAVLRLFGIDPEVASEGSLSEEEIIGVIGAMVSRDPRVRDKQQIIERVLRFSNHPVRVAMVPRVDVVWLRADATGAEAFEMLQKHQFSRIPLVGASVDEIVGYLYAKALLLDPKGKELPDLRGLARKVLFVPESVDCLRALRELQNANTPFAVVVDEYGGTRGIITLEDLVEEVFGEIRDELDAEKPAILQRDVGTWLVDARTSTDDLRQAGVPLDETLPSESVAKLVVDELGHVPRPGDVVRIAENVLAEVVLTSRRRIRRMRISVAAPVADGA